MPKGLRAQLEAQLGIKAADNIGGGGAAVRPDDTALDAELDTAEQLGNLLETVGQIAAQRIAAGAVAPEPAVMLVSEVGGPTGCMCDSACSHPLIARKEQTG